MTAILGISAFYHDSAAALVVDGRVAAAAQEERFSRRKHDAALPVQAIDYCFAQAGLSPGDLDYVAFYEKPLLKFERLLETYLAFAPRGFRSFVRVLPSWLHEKLFTAGAIRQALGGACRKRCLFAGHHESHAASAFFPSPFDEAAILTLDGVGEWTTAATGFGRGNRLTLTHEQRFPHSLGLLYSAFTQFCGFRVNSGEYKLMGLAPYGEPRYAELILQQIVDLKPDGSLRLDLSYFDYCHGFGMTSRKLAQLLGGPPRRPEAPITAREMDLAASIQQVAEEAMLRAARHAHRLTGMKNLCLAGGVALNAVGNGRIVREGPFERVWIQPAAGDAGGALGAAWLAWHQLLGQPRVACPGDQQQGSLLGPSYGEQEIGTLLGAAASPYKHFADDESLCEHVAALLAAGRIVGWFQGRMEFGPRALGARSILADPRDAAVPDRINGRVKFRESFRPFAPAVLRQRAAEYFDLASAEESAYMLLVAPVAEAQRRPAVSPGAGLDRLQAIRSTIPAVTHVDCSARIQTVDRERNPLFHRLLEAFARRTGCPVLVNTSFNVRGEPIVCTPEDAWRSFRSTGLDVLVMERFVVEKDSRDAAIASPELRPD